MIIFWDFNGTILNDVNICVKLLNDSLKIEGKRLVTKQEYLDKFCFPVKTYYESVGFDFNQTSFDILANRFTQGFIDNFYKNKLNKNVKIVLKEFEKRGYTQNVLSATKQQHLEDQIEQLKLRPFFKDLIGIKDIYATSKVDVAKQYLIDNKIDPKDCIVIGDSDHDYLVANSLGMKVYLYTKGHMSPNRLKNYPNFDNFLDLLTII